MEVSVTGQALSFFGAAVLGGALGFLYDFFRLLRKRFLTRMGLALDLLYWPLTVAAFFFYAVAAGNGDIRLYLLAGVVLGGCLYFLLLSSAVLRFGNWLADVLGKFVRFCLIPVVWTVRLGKKFGNVEKSPSIIGGNGIE